MHSRWEFRIGELLACGAGGKSVLQATAECAEDHEDVECWKMVELLGLRLTALIRGSSGLLLLLLLL